MNAFVNDLKFAQTAGRAAEVALFTGKQWDYIGVHEVNEEEGFVSLYTPETMGDSTTTTKVALDSIVSVKVTDVSWK